LYGVLCGLASLEREQLIRILETQSGTLELVPAFRDALQRFCRADYQSCLAVLHQLYPELELDAHLAPHLHDLQQSILHKCLIEYLRPYRKVYLPQMAENFRIPLDRLMDILALLIGNGKIKFARLDCRSQTIEKDPSMEAKERSQKTQQRILNLQESVLNDTYAMIIRMSCLENDQTVDRRKSSYMDFVENSDDDDLHPDEPMDLVAANPEDVY